MKKTFGALAIVMILLLSVCVAACDNEPITQTPDELSFNVSYDANGGQGTAPAKVKYEAGDTFRVAGYTIFSNPGKYMSSWNDGVKEVVPGSEYIMPSRDVVFKAVWDDITDETVFNVTFDIGEANGTAPQSANYHAGEKFYIPDASSFNLNGHRFIKWHEEVENKDYLPGDLYTMPNNSVLFTAKWEDISNTSERLLTYLKGNPNATGDVPEPQIHSQGDVITIADFEPYSLEEYYFLGWTYNGQLYHTGDILVMPDSDVALVATWGLIGDRFAITFVSDGSQGVGPSRRYFDPDNTDEEFFMPGKCDLVRPGYEFLGWSDGKNYYDVGDSVSIEDLYTCLAQDFVYRYNKAQPSIQEILGKDAITLRARWKCEDTSSIDGDWRFGTYIGGNSDDDNLSVHDFENIFVNFNISIKTMSDKSLRVVFRVANINTNGHDNYSDMLVNSFTWGIFTPVEGRPNEYRSSYGGAEDGGTTLIFEEGKMTYKTRVDICEFTDRVAPDKIEEKIDPNNVKGHVYAWKSGSWTITERFDEEYNAEDDSYKGSCDDVNSPDEAHYNKDYFIVGSYIVCHYNIESGSGEEEGYRYFWFNEKGELCALLANDPINLHVFELIS